MPGKALLHFTTAPTEDPVCSRLLWFSVLAVTYMYTPSRRQPSFLTAYFKIKMMGPGFHVIVYFKLTV